MRETGNNEVIQSNNVYCNNIQHTDFFSSLVFYFFVKTVVCIHLLANLN